MSELKLSVDLAGVMQQAGAIINAQVLPLLNQAVRAVAEQTAADWVEGVQRAKLWSGEKDAYAKSIQWKMTGDFSALVWTDYRSASEIETGRPARDLKRMLDTSLKVRKSKEGKRYLIIPFRHDVKSMPPEVHQAAKRLKASSIVGQTTRVSGTGAYDIKTRQKIHVNRNLYSWGGRLVASMLGTAKLDKKHAGMVRFNTSTKGAPRSSYMTFRVMSETSSGWIIGPQPGQFIAKKVVDRIQPLAEKVMQEAVRRSLG